MSADRPRIDAVPVVRIRLGALAANAAPWAGPDAIADLRADASGHGAAQCAAILVRAGIVAVVIDEADRAATAAAGAVVVDAAPTVVPEALFGLTGVGAPVMRCAGTVLQTKALLAGEGVSYGYRHRAPRDTRVALVSGGYAQGVVRALGGLGEVSIAGRRHPIVGRVAMDVCVVDVGAEEVGVGDEAVFFGDPEAGEPAIDAWARATGMRATELTTAVGLRGRRVAT